MVTRSRPFYFQLVSDQGIKFPPGTKNCFCVSKIYCNRKKKKNAQSYKWIIHYYRLKHIWRFGLLQCIMCVYGNNTQGPTKTKHCYLKICQGLFFLCVHMCVQKTDWLIQKQEMLEILQTQLWPYRKKERKTFPASDSGKLLFLSENIDRAVMSRCRGLIMCLYTGSFKECLWVIAVPLINMAATHSIRLAISCTSAKVMYYFLRVI